MTKSARAGSGIVVGALLMLLGSTAGAQGPAQRRPAQRPQVCLPDQLVNVTRLGFRHLLQPPVGAV